MTLLIFAGSSNDHSSKYCKGVHKVRLQFLKNYNFNVFAIKIIYEKDSKEEKIFKYKLKIFKYKLKMICYDKDRLCIRICMISNRLCMNSDADEKNNKDKVCMNSDVDETL